METARAASPLARGIVTGAILGIVAFVVLVLVDHFVLGAAATARYGLVGTLLASAVFGAIFGALVGAVVVLTASVQGGIFTGAAIIVAMNLINVGRLEFMPVIMGIIYGALFGWVVASGVARSLQEG